MSWRRASLQLSWSPQPEHVKGKLGNPSCSWTIIILPLNTWKIFSLRLKGTSKHQIHEDKPFFANIIELLKIFAWETAYLISVTKSLFNTANKLLQNLTVSVVWWIKWHPEKTKTMFRLHTAMKPLTKEKQHSLPTFLLFFFFINKHVFLLSKHEETQVVHGLNKNSRSLPLSLIVNSQPILIFTFEPLSFCVIKYTFVWLWF